MFTIPGLWWLPSGTDDYDAVKWLRRYWNLGKVGEPIVSASGCPTPIHGPLPRDIWWGTYIEALSRAWRYC